MEMASGIVLGLFVYLCLSFCLGGSTVTMCKQVYAKFVIALITECHVQKNEPNWFLFSVVQYVVESSLVNRLFCMIDLYSS